MHSGCAANDYDCIARRDDYWIHDQYLTDPYYRDINKAYDDLPTVARNYYPSMMLLWGDFVTQWTSFGADVWGGTPISAILKGVSDGLNSVFKASEPSLVREQVKQGFIPSGFERIRDIKDAVESTLNIAKITAANVPIDKIANSKEVFSKFTAAVFRDRVDSIKDTLRDQSITEVTRQTTALAFGVDKDRGYFPEARALLRGRYQGTRWDRFV